MRKFEAIDLMKLRSLGSNNGWNKFLTECHMTLNINALAKLRYQIQAGMDDLAKNKLNTEEMVLWFIRLNRSIELTAKKIIRKKLPLPKDNPLIAQQYTDFESTNMKLKRDYELAAFMKRSAY